MSFLIGNFMLKSKLQKTFLKAQNSYTSAAIIQEKMQNTLLEVLMKHKQKIHFQNILELGCGNGSFSKKICNLLTFEHFLALDIVDFSKEFVGEKIQFLQFDMENIKMIKNFYQNLPFDFIASNAALQWCNQNILLPKLSSLACKNAYLLLGIFGTKNLFEIKKFLGVGLEYLDIHQYYDILKKDWDILECFSTLETLHFHTPIEVFRHLKNTGVNVYGDSFILTKKRLLAYQEYFNNQLTYEPIYLLAQKR